MVPKGRTKRNNCILFSLMVLLATLGIFVDVFLDVKNMQYEMIENYVTRMAVSQLSNHADFIARMKTVDLQEIFREITIINTLMAVFVQKEQFISQGYLKYSKANEMISNSQYVALEKELGYSPVDKFMGYVLFPQEMNYEILEEYHPAEKEVDLCAFIQYYIRWILYEPLLELKKTLIYIGFYSELFCEYSASNQIYYTGPPTEHGERYGYNFETEEQVYYPSIRSWFDKGSQENGLTTFVSSYIFAGSGGKFGSTLAQSFMGNDSNTLGVVGFDLIPYTTEETLLNSQHLSDFSMLGEDNINYEYFITEKSNVINKKMYDIGSDLAQSIHSENGKVDVQTLLTRGEATSESSNSKDGE